MGIYGRVKVGQGGSSAPCIRAVASAGTIPVDTNDSVIWLTSTAAVSTATTVVFVCADIRPGRTLTLINYNASDGITLKHTAGGSNANGYFTGTADLALGAYDVATVMQQINGAWLLISASNNAAS